MAANDSIAYGETQPHSLNALGGKERIKDARTDFRRHPRASVFHRQYDMAIYHFRREREVPSIRHCMYRIENHVNQDVAQFRDVSTDVCIGIVLEIEADVYVLGFGV